MLNAEGIPTVNVHDEWTGERMYTDSPPQVAGVSMTVLKAAIIFEKKWLVTRLDAAAACPALEGNHFNFNYQ